ncbi:MAG: ribonuclease P protein component [Muribaculaceae bacterium]|nr:ribonuclease P protein component [Muribaculaceae bacterium]
MKGNRLYKSEKLCSQTAVERLFEHGNATIAYPLRAVYSVMPQDTPHDNGVRLRFLITIPKKKIRHAVDRVLLRRRIREAYRLNRNIVYQSLEQTNSCAQVAFIYLAQAEKADYAIINEKMRTLLERIAQAATTLSHE